ncbi:hypothetical protein Scep_012476 [Stephania cephalantha]|uniref:Uncharacterized protein n=1 Tax=Stephania cephalantha TaxID=152367 RepID=A0AAP0JGY1_9MAGN
MLSLFLSAISGRSAKSGQESDRIWPGFSRPPCSLSLSLSLSLSRRSDLSLGRWWWMMGGDDDDDVVGRRWSKHLRRQVVVSGGLMKKGT